MIGVMISMGKVWIKLKRNLWPSSAPSEFRGVYQDYILLFSVVSIRQKLPTRPPE